METALILSASEKNIGFFGKMLEAVSCSSFTCARSCAEARRALIEADFDVCLIDMPLADETGEALAKNIASKGISQVILTVSAGLCGEVSESVEAYGVITLSKPMNPDLLWNALKIAKAAHNRMLLLRQENQSLNQKIEDMRTVNKAKGLLMDKLKMSEAEAHRYIEKKAMDARLTSRAAAEGVIKNYVNADGKSKQ